MVRLFRLTTIALLLSVVSAHAQQVFQPQGPPVLVQKSPTDLQACTPTHADAAVANQITITIPAVAGMYVYLCGWDFTVTGNGTATLQSNVKWTSTNLGGYAYEYSTPATANTTLAQGSFYYNVPIRSSLPGSAVTIVSPAAATNNAYSANAYFYYAQ